ncbi:uncharacterized protein FA14DRAFT_185466 [Meira miltonrushii]|uniref:F-box domain-containing protein n=1 Tax=Meira miltonrushii TaxID=1280837 RepID=A0A316V9T1_9BASI|nr:uncharacterized protein FA14DRAFT_185466 [Meira miltonrushii]PWN34024.1 hypothetical protein FA14DRAFT_185466 [Meira miltonrushii]
MLSSVNLSYRLYSRVFTACLSTIIDRFKSSKKTNQMFSAKDEDEKRFQEALQNEATNNSSSPPHPLFSDDILCQIFRLITLRDLANAQLVCKQWNKILSDHHAIWWDAIYLDNDLAFERKDFCAVQTFKLASKLLQRDDCNATTPKVFLPIPIDFCSETEIRCALLNITKAGVRCLWILIGANLHCCKAHKSSCRSISHEAAHRLLVCVVGTVKWCSQLTSLRLVTNLNNFAMYRHLPMEEDLPISKCKIEHLTLVNIPLDMFFTNLAIYNAFKTLRSLKISNWSVIDPEQHYLMMTNITLSLAVASESIEEVTIDLHLFLPEQRADYVLNTQKTQYFSKDDGPVITLPKLKTLTFCHTGVPVLLLLVRAPNLVRLNLSPDQCDGSIDFRRWAREHPLLQKVSLRLVHRVGSYSVESSEKALTFIEQQHTMQELVVWEPIKRSQDEIVKFIRYRQNDATSPSLKEVTIIDQEENSLTGNGSRWLENNLPTFNHVYLTKREHSSVAIPTEDEMKANKLCYEQTDLHFYERGNPVNFVPSRMTVIEHQET